MSKTVTAAGAPVKKESEVLPKKESELLKLCSRFFEEKSYKKSIKTADQILAKFPNHGETLAMKGLSINSLGWREEALDLVKAGVKNDMKSSLCWHVYGLIFKSENNYSQAIKSYLQALKSDQGNYNILRDLSYLQLQVKDYSGFLTTRTKILETKGNQRANWVAFAIACYLTKDYKRAYDMTQKCEQPIFQEAAMESEAISELSCFQARCLEKEGRLEEVLFHFKKFEKKITDKLFIRRKTAELLVLLGRFSEALNVWTELLHEQSDNYCFHRGVQCAVLKLDREMSSAMFNLRSLELPCTALSLSSEKKRDLIDFYNESNFKKSRAVSKISLFLLEGEEFREGLKKHLISQIRKEIPSCYQDVFALVEATKVKGSLATNSSKEIYDFRTHPTARLAIELVGEFITSLKDTGNFDRRATTTGTAKEKESPTALLWALYLQAHLLEGSGRLEEALGVIEEAETHTPTGLDILLQKARILKQLGEVQLAAQVSNECRMLDLQDRFLNNKTTKYMLRADRVAEAKQTIHMFVKDELDPEEHLVDMQVNWYLAELGESFSRDSKYGESLRTFTHIKKHFNDYVEDIFDFHYYVFRKCTLNCFADTLEFHEVQKSNKFFQRAFVGATTILLKFASDPVALTAAAEEAAAAAAAAAKAKLEALTKAGGKEDEDSDTDKLADDNFGVKLLSRNPKDELLSWCAAISSALPQCNTQVLARFAEVMTFCGKFVQALRALSIAAAKDPWSSAVFSLVKLARLVRGETQLSANQSKSISDAVVTQVLEEELGRLLSGRSVEEYIDSIVDAATAENSLTIRISAAQCLALVGRSAEAISILTDDPTFIWGVSAKNIKLADVISSLQVVKIEFSEVIDAFSAQAKLRYPRADVFKTAEALNSSWSDSRLPAPFFLPNDLPDASSSTFAVGLGGVGNVSEEEDWELVEKDSSSEATTVGGTKSSTSAAGGGAP